MIHKDKAIVIDLDGTLAKFKGEDQTYEGLEVDYPVLQKLKEYKQKGYYIILHSSRNMQTHDGNVGKINATTLKVILGWLDKHGVPYDEIHIGKPWCGMDGFYVDDKAIRPDEFLKLNHEEIRQLIKKNGS